MPITYSDLVLRLRAAGCVFAEDEASLLVAAAATDDDPGRLEQMVRRREAGEPLEQILGWAEFCGFRVVVEPGVFVPRRRTQFLARQAAAFARPGSVVVDLCCGTGAVGLAIAAMVPGVEVHAADIDPVAVHCARTNLTGALLHAYQGDLFEALPRAIRGRVDVLAVNAPYVPSGQIELMPPEARDHEPRVALDGGADGLGLHRRVAAEAGEWLSVDGRVLIETSDEQAPITAKALADNGFSVRVVVDDELGGTVAIGQASACCAA
jgi:release factor glutamine methyltransferase